MYAYGVYSFLFGILILWDAAQNNHYCTYLHTGMYSNVDGCNVRIQRKISFIEGSVRGRVNEGRVGALFALLDERNAHKYLNNNDDSGSSRHFVL